MEPSAQEILMPPPNSQKAIPAAGLVPHAERMLLIDALIPNDSEHGFSVLAVLKSNGPYFCSDQFKSHWLIEIMSQAVAAAFHYKAKATTCSKGYLIKVDHYECYQETVLAPGDQLAVTVAQEAILAQVGCYKTATFCQGRLLATASLKFLLAD